MVSFPLITRELRVQSRRRALYDTRVLWGIGMVGVLAFFTWNFPAESGSGRNILSLIHGCLAVMLFFLASLGAADAISREKREGTLGLLLLTGLTPTQIVFGKLATHLIHVGYFFLLALPLIIIPMFAGGVSSQEFLLSILVLITIAVTGLAAGLLASTLCASFGFAVAWAIFLNALLTLGITAVALNLLLGLFPTRFLGDVPAFYRILVFGPVMEFCPIIATDIASRFFALGRPLLIFAALILFIALLTIRFVLAFATRRIAQHREFAGETIRQTRFRKQFLTPILLRKTFRRAMSRKLDRNPLLWLEYRTAWSRSARLAMTLLIIGCEAMFLGQSDFIAAHFFVLFVVLTFMTFKSSSSFQYEKETRSFELLLVTPLTEAKMLNSRLRAVAHYYAPVVAAIFFFIWFRHKWALLSIDNQYELTHAVKHTSLIASIFSVPICGLYFALRCRNFLTALMSTAGFAILAPLCLWSAFNGLLWMAAGRGTPAFAVRLDSLLRDIWWPALIAVLVYHVIVIEIAHRGTLRLLQDRRFTQPS